MCGIFKHKTIRHYKYLSETVKVKQVRAMLWICGADQNQTMKGESYHLCKLQMESRVIQIAKADSVINGVS